MQAAERQVAELSAHCTELEADHSQFEADFAHLREDIEQCTALQVSAAVPVRNGSACQD